MPDNLELVVRSCHPLVCIRILGQPPPAERPLGDALEPGPPPLRVDPPDVDIRRTVEPAAWVWSGTGVAAQ
jgi:hypothetical protein